MHRRLGPSETESCAPKLRALWERNFSVYGRVELCHVHLGRDSGRRLLPRLLWHLSRPSEDDAHVTTWTDDGLVLDYPRSTAVLVVRTWREDGSFRATLTWSADVVSGQPWERGAASCTEEVLAIVERWLRAS